MEREFLDILQKQEASETAAYQSAALIRQIIKDDFSNSAEILQVIDACGTELTDFFRMPSCIPFQRKIPLPVRTCDFFHAAKHTLSQIPYLHSHNFYEYIYVLRGNCTQHTETPAQTILLKAHQSCLLSPGVSHIVERCGKEDIILKFAVSESLFREVILPFSSAGMEKDVLIFHHSNAQISMCIYMLLKESRNPCEFGETAIRNYLSLLFIELMRKPPAPYPDIIEKLCSYFEEDPGGITLQKFAAIAGYSADHTGRLIKNSTGRSFVEYIRDLKLARAAGLLMETDYTIEHVAALSGYANPSGFYKQFCRAYGISPGEYRKTF